MKLDGCLGLLVASLLTAALYGQAPADLFPDITHFKLQLPLDKDGKDYRGIDYDERDNPRIKNAIVEKLDSYVAPPPYSSYFFLSGKEMVFRAHCAGALTSSNAYPRCELRERIKGRDTFWDYQDEHELNVTLRITELPKEKQEVCVVQLKGTNTPSATSGTSEVLRVEYRRDGKSGWHLEVNESSGPRNVLDYKAGDTVSIRAHVHKGEVTLQMKNLSNGDRYQQHYQSEFSHGYFKAGAYTQSSIWSEKSGAKAEQPDSASEVRFSQFILGSIDSDEVGTPAEAVEDAEQTHPSPEP